MIAIGAGGLDVAVCMAGPPVRAAVPEDRRRLSRERACSGPWIQAKDVILELLRRRGVRGGRGAIFEFTGPGVLDAELHRARDDREHDRRAGCDRRGLPGGRRDEGWFDEQERSDDFTALETGDAEDDFDEVEHIDLAALVPLVAKPSSPGNVVPVDELVGTPLAQVCVGSSVNSSYEDMAVVRLDAARAAASPRSSISATATPGSRQILDQITQSGTYVDLLTAGVRMLEPACGPCVGMGQAPPSGANSLRTFNRNFPGRSGTADDNVYLCSPAVAAASMLTGEIADPRELTPPELPARPAARPAVVQGHILEPVPPTRRVDRDPARAEHQAAAGAEGAAGHARAAGADRRAGRHLDRRPLARRRDGDGLPLERARRSPSSRSSTATRSSRDARRSGAEASSSPATTTARARAASTQRSRRPSSASAR